MRLALSTIVLALLLGCATPESHVGPSAANPSSPSAYTALPRPGKDVCPVPAVGQPIQLDGRLDEGEWLGLENDASMMLRQTHDLEPAKQPSQVWLMRDRLNLYVGVLNQIDSTQSLRKDSEWGTNDGVELSFRSVAKGETTYILRGYPSMRFQILSSGGAKRTEIERISDGVSIRAKLEPGGRYWTMEWSIPLRVVGIDPRSDRRVAFNITVCKPGSKEMVCWRPSTAESWRLDGKGTLELAPQPPPRRIMVPGLTPTAD
jgi:hypothetical protein